TCRGREVCGVSGWSACDAPAAVPEICNGLDDDCDGVIDNGFRDDAGVYFQDAHCGRCETDCSVALPGAQNATGICQVSGGRARCVPACLPGSFDLDGVAADGCEFTLDGAAIYVSATEGDAVDDPSCGLGPAGTGG